MMTIKIFKNFMLAMNCILSINFVILNLFITPSQVDETPMGVQGRMTKHNIFVAFIFRRIFSGDL